MPNQTHQTPTPQRRKAFTLVELLVVIGIIALLISILLPALNKVRQQSLKVNCGANLRSIGQSLFTYAHDNKGNRYPRTSRTTQNGSFLPAMYWATGGRVQLRDEMGATWGDSKMWMCPAPGSESYPHQLSDENRLGTVWQLQTNYFFWFADPGMWGSPASPKNWRAAPGRDATGPNYWKGPFSTKDSSRMMLVSDILAISQGGTAPPVGFAMGNHVPSAGTLGEHDSKRQRLETFIFPAAEINRSGVGANILYNDGHVDFRAAAELTPIDYDQPVLRTFFGDIPDDFGYFHKP